MLRRSRIDDDDEFDGDELGGDSAAGAVDDDPFASLRGSDDEPADDDGFSGFGADEAQGEPAPPSSDTSLSDEAVDIRGMRLLVVNDDVNSCELVARLVEALGCRARRVNSPDGVVAFVADPINEIGGVVLDLRGGLAASGPILEDIRMLDGPQGRVPVVVLSSTADDPASAYGAGADLFLARPFHVDEFLNETERVLTSSPASLEATRATR